VATKGSQEVIFVNPAQKWANFHFISALSTKATQISIDQHPMWIYAVDGNYITPQQVDSFLMYNGERYSVMVQLDNTPGDYIIRFANNLPDQLISGYATMAYAHSRSNTNSTPSINYAGNPVSSDIRVLDTTTLQPFNQAPPANEVNATYIVDMGRYGANWEWTLNNKSTWALSLDNQAPLLFTDSPSTAGNDSLTIRTYNNTWIDIILQVTLGPQNPAQPPHPIHKHSNKGYLIGSGTGAFNYSSVAEAIRHIPQSFNISTAVMRDSFTTPAILFDPAWVALRYYVHNPGAWFIHCHIQTHLTGGMAIAILDGIDAWPSPPVRYIKSNGL
jgi:FtsP/CotA-like multicopper oxidase with cupredoxin domain